MPVKPEHTANLLVVNRGAPGNALPYPTRPSENTTNPLHTLTDLQMSEEQDSDQETQDDAWDDRVPMEQVDEKEDQRNDIVDQSQNTRCGLQGNGSVACAPGAAAESPDLHNNEPIDTSWRLDQTRSLRGHMRLSPTNYARIVKARSPYNVQLLDTDRAANDNGDDDGLEYDEFLVMSTAERDVRAAFRHAACAAEGRYHDEKSTSNVFV